MGGKEDARRYIEEHLKQLFDEEIAEAGVRFARARVAEDCGLTDIASILKEVAYDEAKHAAWIARFNPEEELEDIKEGIMGAIGADSDAAQREKEFAKTAREAGMEEVARLFEQLSIDEMDHVKKLREALAKLEQAKKP